MEAKAKRAFHVFPNWFVTENPELGRFYALTSVLLLITVFRLWLMPMANSFWLDETLIVQIIKDGFTQISSNAPVTQSVPFCWIEWLAARIFGVNEFTLRLPSVLAGILTLYVYFRVGSEIRDNETGLFFATVYICLPQVTFEIPNARPYSLALTSTAAALLCCFRWLRTGRIHYGILWTVFSVIACYMQIFFFVSLVITGLYVLCCGIGKRTISINHFFLCGLLGLLMLLPSAPPTLAMLDEAPMLSFASKPSFTSLLVLIFPLTVIFPTVLVSLLGLAGGEWFRWKALGKNAKPVILGFLIVFVCSTIFFIISHLTNVQLFISRYLLPTAPGLVLMWGSLLRAFEPLFLRRILMVSILAMTVTIVGGFNLVPDFRGENWRSIVYPENWTGK